MENEYGVFKLKFDCGRSGELNGVFIAKKSKVDFLINSGLNVYFGEVLGKHSEIYGPIEASDVQLVSDTEEAIKWCTPNGYNPFNYTTIMTDREDFEDLTVDEVIDILMVE